MADAPRNGGDYYLGPVIAARSDTLGCSVGSDELGGVDASLDGLDASAGVRILAQGEQILEGPRRDGGLTHFAIFTGAGLAFELRLRDREWLPRARSDEPSRRRSLPCGATL